MRTMRRPLLLLPLLLLLTLSCRHCPGNWQKGKECGEPNFKVMTMLLCCSCSRSCCCYMYAAAVDGAAAADQNACFRRQRTTPSAASAGA